MKIGIDIGGTKISNGKLKNLYPKGMRVWITHWLLVLVVVLEGRF
mgnify:CR=1 FL=1